MNQERSIRLEKRYLCMPIRCDAPLALVRIECRGKLIREFVAELDGEKPDFWVHADLEDYQGQSVRILAEGEPLCTNVLDSLKQEKSPPIDAG